MRIDYLARHRHLIPEVASLVYHQCADLFHAGGTSEHDVFELFAARAVIDRLPITLVAMEGPRLVGAGSLKLDKPDTQPGFSPWLAGMYVKDEFRGSGIGALPVQALERKARELGVATMYLSVGSATGFYQRLGWHAMEQLTSYGVKDVTLMARSLVTESP